MNVAPDHPALAGHFPGSPVLPAVVLLTEVLAEIEALTGEPPQRWTIATAKFQSPARPGERLVLSHSRTSSDGIRFEVRAAGGVVASGTLARRQIA
jgi:3-hydroxymyristoyl/3-hydroxydecanoyl-(acyl carrier protein) dehydratase